MALPFDSALQWLAADTRANGDADKARSRLETFTRLLDGELEGLQAQVLEAAQRGPSPGTDAATHLVRTGGKRVRPLALLLSTACFGPFTEAARQMAVVAELVHTATLLHDDVIDEGTERRGVPAARRIWGNAVSVLGGDLMLVEALERTERHAPLLLPDLIAALRRLVCGEIVQLRGRTELDVSEATYERILREKTASLFSWATRTGAGLAGASDAEQQALGVFGERLGVAFQLVDDVLDYLAEGTGKTPLADLREGKLTLPLVLAVGERPELLGAVRAIHAGELDRIAEVKQSVVASGACEKVRGRARDHTRRAVEALELIRPSAARQLLKDVAEQLAARAA
jgi:octaprenyl-diphosphate synthase